MVPLFLSLVSPLWDDPTVSVLHSILNDEATLKNGSSDNLLKRYRKSCSSSNHFTPNQPRRLGTYAYPYSHAYIRTYKCIHAYIHPPIAVTSLCTK